MTADRNEVWYHCGRCGKLFQSTLGGNDSRVCGSCQQNPSVGLWPLLVNEFLEQDEVVPNESHTKIKVKKPAKSPRRKSRSKSWRVIISAWVLLMLVAIFLHHFFSESRRKLALEEAGRKSAEAKLVADKKASELAAAVPECRAALSGFLTAKEFSEKAANTFAGSRDMDAIKDFFGRNTFPDFSADSLEAVDADFIVVGDERMVKICFKDDAGKESDAIFKMVSGEWKLDWKYFVRYSDVPWEEFIKGAGPDIALFRLLATRTPIDEDSGNQALKVTFFPVGFDLAEMEKESLYFPQFDISLRSEEGLTLDAAFKDQEKGKALFTNSLGIMEGKRLVRVRVRIKRESAGTEFIFKLDELVGCHWIDSKTLGYDVGQLRYGLFEN